MMDRRTALKHLGGAASALLLTEALAAEGFPTDQAPTGTPAASMPGQVDESVKQERLTRLQARLEAQQRGFNAGVVGRTVPVLFEKAGRHPGQVLGRSPYLQAVHCDGPASLIGEIAPVTIGQAAQNSLTGELAPETA